MLTDWSIEPNGLLGPSGAAGVAVAATGACAADWAVVSQAAGQPYPATLDSPDASVGPAGPTGLSSLVYSG